MHVFSIAVQRCYLKSPLHSSHVGLCFYQKYASVEACARIQPLSAVPRRLNHPPESQARVPTTGPLDSLSLEAPSPESPTKANLCTFKETVQ